MKLRWLSLILATCFALGVCGVGSASNIYDSVKYRLPFALLNDLKLNDNNTTTVEAAATQRDESALKFEQLVDHFGGSNQTFKQTYYVNNKYAKSSSRVNILYLMAEFANSDFVNNKKLPHVLNAKKLKASVWCLEHRFYGFSNPFRDSSVESLKYLTVDQAVEDIARFITVQNENSKGSKPKWILYGGGYQGALALWFHRKYHDSLSLGVVSSSPFYQATVNYYHYEKLVEDAYGAHDAKCLAGITNSLKRLHQMLQNSQGRTVASKQLTLASDLNSLNLTYDQLQFFNFVITFYLQLPVEANNVNYEFIRGDLSISRICDIFKNERADFLNLVEAVGVIKETLGGKANEKLFVDYNQIVKYLTESASQPSPVRSFLWLYCTQLGDFVTSDYGGLAVESSIPNNFFLGVCANAFGSAFSIDILKAGVNYTNTVHGYSNGGYYAPNAIITQGDVDPWRYLGVRYVEYTSSYIINIDQAGHSSDLQPVDNSKDTKSLKSARSEITKTLKEWVNTHSSDKKDENKTHKKKKHMEEKMHHHSHHHQHDEQQQHKRNKNEQKIKNWKGKIEKIPAPDENKLREKLKEKRRAALASGELRLDVTRTETFAVKMERLYEEYLLGEKEGGKIEPIKGDITYATIEQDVDHFDGGNKKTYKQLFINNPLSAESSKELNFLMIGGESPISWIYVSFYLTIGELALLYNADLYVLEHRYYGDSIVTEDLSTENLQWLSSEQALADAAVFISSVNEEKGYKNPKWVLFGGSYPGSLVAWHRLKYPELSVGGIASSAPVQAKTDMYEYMQVVNQAIVKYGGVQCEKDVKYFFDWHQRKTNSPEGRTTISKVWGLCPEWVEPFKSEKDVNLIMASLAFAIAGSVQYDGDGHRDLKAICSTLNEIDGYLKSLPDETSGDVDHSGSDSVVEDSGSDGDVDSDDSDDDYENNTSTTNTLKKISRALLSLVFPDEMSAMDDLASDNSTSSVALLASLKAKHKALLKKPTALQGRQHHTFNEQLRKQASKNHTEKLYEDPSSSSDSDSYEDSYSNSKSNSNSKASGSKSSSSSSPSPSSSSTSQRESSASTSTSHENMDEFFCFNANYEQYVDFMNLQSQVYTDGRCWIYTVCSELGVSLSTNLGPNVFESALPVNFNVDMCKDLFGPQFTRDFIDTKVRFTNENYGGQHNYEGTNTVFINGSEDPWHPLSVYEPYIPAGRNVTSLLMDGTSHCTDMFSFLIERNLQVNKARTHIRKQIEAWIKN